MTIFNFTNVIQSLFANVPDDEHQQEIIKPITAVVSIASIALATFIVCSCASQRRYMAYSQTFSVHRAPGSQEHVSASTHELTHPDSPPGLFSEEKMFMVGWGDYKVFSVVEKLPYTEQLGPCIAVLMRGTPLGRSNPTHLGVAHIFSSIDCAVDCLDEMTKRISKGTIEIFITAGRQDRTGSRQNHLDFVTNLRSRRRGSVTVRLCQDRFGIDFREIIRKDPTDNLFHRGSISTVRTGFDRHLNPYTILGASF